MIALDSILHLLYSDARGVQANGERVVLCCFDGHNFQVLQFEGQQLLMRSHQSKFINIEELADSASRI